MWDIVVLAAALIAGGQQPGVRQGQAATGTASIGGVVAKADTGAPIARATLGVARQGVQANDLGQFRLCGLPPGKYYIAAAMRDVDLATVDPTAKRPEVMRGARGLPPTFLPGPAGGAAPPPVSGPGGEDPGRIRFALSPVRLARISGVV